MLNILAAWAPLTVLFGGFGLLVYFLNRPGRPQLTPEEREELDRDISTW